MLTWHGQTEKYGNYWCMDKKEYPYKIFFFEKEGDSRSCGNKFPIICKNKTTFTKESFVKYIQKAFEPINKTNLGITYKFVGYENTDNDDLAFLIKDDINAIVYYSNVSWGGLSAPFSKSEFGIKLNLISKIHKEWFLSSLRHEMTHALGFAHKDIDFQGLKGQIVINGLDGLGEFTADTIHGIKTVYNIDSKFIINGNITNINSLENSQIFIYNARTKNIMYQSPIDSNGYFEFRIDNFIKKFNILAIGKENDKYWYGKLSKNKALKKKIKNYRFDELKMNNYCNDLKFIKDNIGIVL